PDIGLADSPCCDSRRKASSREFGEWNSKSCTSGPPLSGGLDSLDDLVVAGTAAEVSHHPVLDLVLGRVGVCVQQCSGGDDLARGAYTTLETAVVDEGLLDRIQPVAIRDTL